MKHGDRTMTPLPMLKGLRTAQSLSQRALAKKSGVAHDTIGQIERGERLARLSTARKLAAALNVDPFMLSCSFEELASLTEEELIDVGATPEAIDVLRGYFIQVGFEEASDEWEERKAAASYRGILEDIDLAYKKLNPLQADSIVDELVEMTEAALLLTRTSAQLLHFITSELKANNYASRRPKLSKFDRPLVDAWLEGAAATKRLLDIHEEFSRRVGELNLEAGSGVEAKKEESSRNRSSDP